MEKAYTLTDKTGKTTAYGNLKTLVKDIADVSKYTTIWRGVCKASEGKLETPYFVYDGFKIQETEMKRHKKNKK